MNKITAIALSSLLSAGAAMADGLSREDVVAELVRARNAGELSKMQSESYGYSGFSQPVLTAKSNISREAVTAELRVARQTGELARRDAESYSPSVTPVASTTTRAQVLAELQAARASGEFAQLNSNNQSFTHLATLKKAPTAAELLAGQPATAR
jgi:Domain of unknown function (DUF4148)